METNAESDYITSVLYSRLKITYRITNAYMASLKSCNIALVKNQCILRYKTLYSRCYRRMEDICSPKFCPVQRSIKFIRTALPNLSHYHYKPQNPR
jgi:hypothetical protein